MMAYDDAITYYLVCQKVIGNTNGTKNLNVYKYFIYILLLLLLFIFIESYRYKINRYIF